LELTIFNSISSSSYMTHLVYTKVKIDINIYCMEILKEPYTLLFVCHYLFLNLVFLGFCRFGSYILSWLRMGFFYPYDHDKYVEILLNIVLIGILSFQLKKCSKYFWIPNKLCLSSKLGQFKLRNIDRILYGISFSTLSIFCWYLCLGVSFGTSTSLLWLVLSRMVLVMGIYWALWLIESLIFNQNPKVNAFRGKILVHGNNMSFQYWL